MTPLVETHSRPVLTRAGGLGITRPTMYIYILLFGFLTSVFTLSASEIPLDDATIVLGERVGPIEKGMTLFGLKTLLGAGKVKPTKIPGPEGTELEGVRLFTGTERELEILLDEESQEKDDSLFAFHCATFAVGSCSRMRVAGEDPGPENVLHKDSIPG